MSICTPDSHINLSEDNTCIWYIGHADLIFTCFLPTLLRLATHSDELYKDAKFYVTECYGLIVLLFFTDMTCRLHDTYETTQ